jgi:hypothetical protein
MPFTSYDSFEAVARAYRLGYRKDSFVQFAEVAPLRAFVREELDFAQKEVAYERSEASLGENFIYPLLKEVWKPYRDKLTLWSHEALAFDDDLCGTPDYMVSKRSPYGIAFLEPPVLVTVEAKRDEFLKANGQCLAAMLTAQKLNAVPELTVFGIITNGMVWEFSQLHDTLYTRDPRSFTLAAVDELYAALHFLLQQCCTQVINLRVPA